MNSTRTVFFVCATFVAAIFISFIQLPYWASLVKPDWLVLALFYWVLALPNIFGVGTAWVLGLSLDLINNSPIGANAFAMVISTYFLIRYNKKIRSMNFFSKIFVVFVLLTLYQFSLYFLVPLFYFSTINSLVHA